MNLPHPISALLAAQDNFNSKAYADCFADNALVHDEGKDHTGKEAIRQWNEMTNAKYHTKLEPTEITTQGSETILTAKGSGTFDGSPVMLKYHFEITGTKITSLKITG